MTFNEQLAKYLTETWSYQKNVKFLGNSVRDGVPSPEDKKPITSVESPLGITVCGKNLFDSSKITSSNYMVEENGRIIRRTNYITSSGALFQFYPNTTYRISYMGILTPGSSGKTIGAVAYHNGRNLVTLSSYGTGEINTTYTTPDTLPGDGLYRLYFYGASTLGDNEYGYTFENFMITYDGVEDRTWQPYKGTTVNVPIKDTENNTYDLHKVVDTKFNVEHYDEIDLYKGVLYKRIAKTTLTASDTEDWRYNGAKSSGGINTHTFEARNIKLNNPREYEILTFNDTLPDVTYNSINYADEGISSWYGANATLRLGINQDRIDGLLDPEAPPLAKFGTWLSDNNIELLYVMRTPKTIPLHADTINLLNNLFLRRPDDDSEYNVIIPPVAPTITYDTFKWQEPVYDRTLQNAKNARMGIQADFGKGIFSDTVWNRIKGNQIVIKYLISWFYEYIPVELLDLAVKKQDLAGFASWADVESWITDLDLNEMATNDRTLMSQIPTAHANYVPPKNDYVGGLGNDSTSPDWNDLNILERTLQLIKETILSTIANYRICGEPITAKFSEQQIDIL